jgi:anti-sigma regulatory factor (Ser/Thr protein kinase)
MAETLAIAADLGELVRVGAWAEALAERWSLPASTAFGVSLCLEEAVSNAIRHGYPEGPEGAGPGIGLSLDREPGALTLVIEDHGIAFDPLGHATPALPGSVENAQVGGMGIHLMRKFARSLDYERRDGANRLTIRFDLGSPEPAT